MEGVWRKGVSKTRLYEVSASKIPSAKSCEGFWDFVAVSSCILQSFPFASEAVSPIYTQIVCAEMLRGDVQMRFLPRLASKSFQMQWPSCALNKTESSVAIDERNSAEISQKLAVWKFAAS